jgi:acetoin utilization protein AcuB
MVGATPYVRDIMSQEVVTLKAGDHLDLASDIMKLGRIRHMPVLSGDHLVGMVTQRDLFRGAVSSVLSFRPSAEREWLAKIRVEEVMTTPVFSAQSDWTVRQALDLMLDKRIGCLPVVEGERLIGLLSETDCLRLLVRILASGDTAPPGRNGARGS